jgi:hypothetical protein
MPQVAMNYTPFVQGEYGYCIDWRTFYAPAALYAILKRRNTS